MSLVQMRNLFTSGSPNRASTRQSRLIASTVACFMLLGCTTPEVSQDSASFPALLASPEQTVAGLPSPAAGPGRPSGTAEPTLEAIDEASSPTGLGDDPELQALADQCYAGLLIECDRLVEVSPSGSPYERYGVSCGGRVRSSGRCAGELVSNSVSTATLLASGVLLRSGPSLDDEALVRIDGLTGEGLSVLEQTATGWIKTVVLGQEGWMFGAFVVPAPDGFVVARDSDGSAAQLRDASGTEIEASNASGSFVLVADQSSRYWRILQPDGTPAYIDPNEFDVLSEG